MNNSLLVNSFSTLPSNPLGGFVIDRKNALLMLAVAGRILAAPSKFNGAIAAASLVEAIGAESKTRGLQVQLDGIVRFTNPLNMPEPFRSSMLASSNGSLKQNRTAALNIVRFLLSTVALSNHDEISVMAGVLLDILTNPKSYDQTSGVKCIMGKFAARLGAHCGSCLRGDFRLGVFGGNNFNRLYLNVLWPDKFFTAFNNAKQPRTRARIAVLRVLDFLGGVE